MVLRLGNFKMPAVVMENAKTLHLSKKVYQHYKILVTVTQNVPQTNNTSTRGMNEE
jgi:hypothetical protein